MTDFRVEDRRQLVLTMRMNSTRLFVLGALARGGPMHGHQIRRMAQIDRMDLWADVKPGSLYGALHRMAAEEIIEVVRTEQSGNLPSRTVYAITPLGRRELEVHRDDALRTVQIRPDPVDLALQNTVDLPEDRLRELLQDRLRVLSVQLESWLHLREEANPYLGGMERMTFRHAELRIRAEIAWHEELLSELTKLIREEPTEQQT
jgi:DNA-binding PadR family transcriptional regulator